MSAAGPTPALLPEAAAFIGIVEQAVKLSCVVIRETGHSMTRFLSLLLATAPDEVTDMAEEAAAEAAATTAATTAAAAAAAAELKYLVQPGTAEGTAGSQPADSTIPTGLKMMFRRSLSLLKTQSCTKITPVGDKPQAGDVVLGIIPEQDEHLILRNSRENCSSSSSSNVNSVSCTSSTDSLLDANGAEQHSPGCLPTLKPGLVSGIAKQKQETRQQQQQLSQLLPTPVSCPTASPHQRPTQQTAASQATTSQLPTSGGAAAGAAGDAAAIITDMADDAEDQKVQLYLMNVIHQKQLAAGGHVHLPQFVHPSRLHFTTRQLSFCSARHVLLHGT
jgi:hypothetical protein